MHYSPISAALKSNELKLDGVQIRQLERDVKFLAGKLIAKKSSVPAFCALALIENGGKLELRGVGGVYQENMFTRIVTDIDAPAGYRVGVNAKALADALKRCAHYENYLTIKERDHGGPLLNIRSYRTAFNLATIEDGGLPDAKGVETVESAFTLSGELIGDIDRLLPFTQSLKDHGNDDLKGLQIVRAELAGRDSMAAIACNGNQSAIARYDAAPGMPERLFMASELVTLIKAAAAIEGQHPLSVEIGNEKMAVQIGRMRITRALSPEGRKLTAETFADQLTPAAPDMFAPLASDMPRDFAAAAMKAGADTWEKCHSGLFLYIATDSTRQNWMAISMPLREARQADESDVVVESGGASYNVPTKGGKIELTKAQIAELSGGASTFDVVEFIGRDGKSTYVTKWLWEDSSLTKFRTVPKNGKIFGGEVRDHYTRAEIEAALIMNKALPNEVEPFGTANLYAMAISSLTIGQRAFAAIYLLKSHKWATQFWGRTFASCFECGDAQSVMALIEAAMATDPALEREARKALVFDAMPPAPPLEEIESQSAPVEAGYFLIDNYADKAIAHYPTHDAARKAHKAIEPRPTYPKQQWPFTWKYMICSETRKTDCRADLIEKTARYFADIEALQAATIYDAPIGPELPAPNPANFATLSEYIRAIAGTVLWFVGRWSDATRTRYEYRFTPSEYAAAENAWKAVHDLPAQAPVSAYTTPAPECETGTPYDALAGRVAEIEARLAVFDTLTPLSGELDSAAPVPPRSAEYEASPDMGGQHGRAIASLRRDRAAADDGQRTRRLRIVRAYLKMRKQRAELRAESLEWEELQHRTWEKSQGHRMNAKRLEANFEAAQGEIVRAERQRDEARAQIAHGVEQLAIVTAERDEAREMFQTELLRSRAWHDEAMQSRRRRRHALAIIAKHRTAARAATLDLASTRNLLDIRTAALVKLERNMADPMQPERQSDIARLVQERDAARAERDSALAKAARMEMAGESLSAQIDAMAARMVRAEQALKRAGVTPMAAVA